MEMINENGKHNMTHGLQIMVNAMSKVDVYIFQLPNLVLNLFIFKVYANCFLEAEPRDKHDSTMHCCILATSHSLCIDLSVNNRVQTRFPLHQNNI